MKRRGFLQMLGIAAPVAAIATKTVELPPVELPPPPAGDELVDIFFETKPKMYRVPLELRPGGNFGHFNPDGGELGRGSAPTYETAYLTKPELEIYEELGILPSRYDKKGRS